LEGKKSMEDSHIGQPEEAKAVMGGTEGVTIKAVNWNIFGKKKKVGPCLRSSAGKGVKWGGDANQGRRKYLSSTR